MSEKQDDKKSKPAFIDANRRGFLQGAAVAGGVAASGVAVAADSIDQSDQSAIVVDGQGYELNDYVKKYYKRVRS